QTVRAARRARGARRAPDEGDESDDGERRPAGGARVSELEVADEVRAALRALVDETSAISARIVEHDDLRTGVPARTLALGGGEYLRVELPTRHSRNVDVEAAFERATRQLRAIRRRWEIARLPEGSVSSGPMPTNDLIAQRV